MSNSGASNRSALKDFLASIATIQGDLSNITAPPFVLGEHSTVELPQYWADHPSLFTAAARGSSPEERSLLVLKWFLGSLRNQQYAGRNPSDGVKKPINSILGELFFGSWKDDELGETRLISEQVSHHPPVTACYLWNDRHGVRAEGFTCQEITFSGSVSIKQKGYAILHIDEYNEDYLIPVPTVKVKGILSGSPYPELTGTYSVVSSAGFVSEVKFGGKGLLGGGVKNGIEATGFHVDRPDEAIYTVSGSWSGVMTIADSRSGQVIEEYDTESATSAPITVQDRAEQDPWESQRVWSGVMDGLKNGNMKAVSDEKAVVEQGQRQMRKDEKAQHIEWERIFFERKNQDSVFRQLVALAQESSYTVDEEAGIWKVDKDAILDTKKPYHGEMLPTGEPSKQEQSSPVLPITSTEDQGIALRDRTMRHEPTVQTSQKHTSLENHGTLQAEKDFEGETMHVGTPTIATKPSSIEKEECGQSNIKDVQVEEFLRAKYTSSPR